MSAYGFQLRFVPYIEEGSKNCTVRALRFGKAPHVKPGGTMQLYTGLRTKQCRKIGDATCSWVQDIVITKAGIVLREAEYILLGARENDEFAWKDGFRPEGTTLDNPAGAFELMVRFIAKNYGVPFEGVVISWNDFRSAK